MLWLGFRWLRWLVTGRTRNGRARPAAAAARRPPRAFERVAQDGRAPLPAPCPAAAWLATPQACAGRGGRCRPLRLRLLRLSRALLMLVLQPQCGVAARRRDAIMVPEECCSPRVCMCPHHAHPPARPACSHIRAAALAAWLLLPCRIPAFVAADWRQRPVGQHHRRDRPDTQVRTPSVSLPNSKTT